MCAYTISCLLAALLSAFESGKNIRVIIVDSRPSMEGKLLLRSLAKAGMRCDYCLVNAVSYMMGDVTKIVLGASAMLSNGAALANVGTALVAGTNSPTHTHTHPCRQ